MAFLIASPLAIVPLVWWLSHAYCSAEQISLAVVSFASIGHHLPGFLRAYFDQELFARFRWRFLLAPPTAFAAALAFGWFDFHALTLALLFWATWHVMVQTYGFMRIYDLKQARSTRRGARLDFALCACVFVSGVLFSDARVSAIAELLWKVGCPRFGPAELAAARAVVGALTVLCVLGYLVNMLFAWRAGQGLNWLKLVSVFSTGMLYWLCGSISQDVLIGVATFEVFHAVQYNAIVWSYNCGSTRRNPNALGLLGWIFQDRVALVCIYLALIALFGSLRLGSEYLLLPVWQDVLRSALIASTILHFYYDGFIWKVSEPATARNMNMAGVSATPRPTRAFWQPLLLVSLAIGLFTWEMQARGRDRSESELVDYLARLTPQLPEIQSRAAQTALAENRVDEALEFAHSAVRGRPRSHQAHATLGLALLKDNRHAEAAHSLAEAVRLQPSIWQNYCDLATAQAGAGEWAKAEQSFQAAAAIAPRSANLHDVWGQTYAHHGKLELAIAQWRLAVDCDPASEAGLRLAAGLSAIGEHSEAASVARQQLELRGDRAANLCLAQVLAAGGQPDAAVAYFETALQFDPASADAWTGLGKAQLAAGHADEALRALTKACELEPDQAGHEFERGVCLQTLGRLDQALVAYRRCTDLDPRGADAFGNLGAVLMQQGDLRHAEAALRRAVSLSPQTAAVHQNLGALLAQTGRVAEAEIEFQRAAECDSSPPGPKASASDQSAAGN